MIELAEHLLRAEDWIAERVQSLSAADELAAGTAPGATDVVLSATELVRALARALQTPDAPRPADSTLLRNLSGLPLAEAMRRIKLFRRACRSLPLPEDPAAERTYRGVLGRFFDDLEQALCDQAGACTVRKLNSDLEEARDLNRSLLDVSGGLVMSLDRAGRVRLMNAEGCRMLGLPQDEILGRDWCELCIPEENRDQVREVIHRILGGEVDRYRRVPDQEIVTADGRRRLIRWSNTLMTDTEGRPTGTLSAGRDITEQREAERALQESTTWLTNIFSGLDDAMFILDPERRIIDANPAAETITGYRQDEVMGRTMEFLYENRDRYLDFERQVEDAFDRSESAHFESRLRRKDGEVIPTEHGVTQLEREGGVPLGIVSVVRDITERKRAEQDRQRVFNMSLDMLCVAGFDGLLREINPSWERTLGWSPDELKSRPWVEFIHPDDMDATIISNEQLMRGKPVITLVNRWLHKNGHYRWISWNMSADQDRKLVFAVARDVTDQKRLENELKRLATTDSLTGARNRHHFMETAERELHRAKRYGRPLSVLMIDIDHFKRINDTYGHHAGDEVLKSMVAACEEEIRETDIFGRLGGEEFAVALAETDHEAALDAAERLRRRLESLCILVDGETICFTASIGVASMTDSTDELEGMLGRADKALYEAKRRGRNRVISAREP
ncbi:MAG: PAS domain S-box protein [Desulfovibrionaceae bacterium]